MKAKEGYGPVTACKLMCFSHVPFKIGSTMSHTLLYN